jgi:hypothetical protein
MEDHKRGKLACPHEPLQLQVAAQMQGTEVGFLPPTILIEEIIRCARGDTHPKQGVPAIINAVLSTLSYQMLKQATDCRVCLVIMQVFQASARVTEVVGLANAGISSDIACKD